MRYWIYWNDLVQGPFEVQELASLRAFTAELLVCEEDRQEWAPAAAVSELLPYFQLAPVAPAIVSPAPPPPPPQPPTLIPLQGEFFSELYGQQQLFDSNGSGRFYFRSAQENAELATEPTLPPLLTPFHFLTGTAQPPIQEIPFDKRIEPVYPELEETGIGAAEPEQLVETDVEPPPAKPIEKSIPIFMPPPVVLPPIPKVAPPAAKLPVPQSPLPSPLPRPTSGGGEGVRERGTRPQLVSLPESFEPVPPVYEKTRLWPWILAMAAVFALGGVVFYFRLETPKPSVIETKPTPAPAPEPEVIEEEIEPPPEPVKPPPPKPLVKKPKAPPPKRTPKPNPIPKPEPVVEEKPREFPVAIPGMTDPEPVPATVEVPAPAPAPPPTEAPGLWRGKEPAAIDLVLNKKIYGGKRTIGANATVIMEQLHEKELLHAAETGERLYYPDKITWSALREEGARYRVYLNFLAWQANGERTLTKSAQFIVQLDKKTVEPADDATRKDFFDSTTMVTHESNPKAAEIQTVLNGVDLVNKFKLRAVILKSDRQREEKKKTEAGLKAAEDKLQKQIVYFRTKYAEKALQNVAKAYGFVAILKGK